MTPTLLLGNADTLLLDYADAALIYADINYGLAQYEGDDREDYGFIRPAFHALKDGGSLAVSCHPKQVWVVGSEAHRVGFAAQETIIWRYRTRNGQPKDRLAPEFEPICLFSKGPRSTFHPERIMQPSLFPGVKTYRKGRVYEAPTEKLPGDVWEIPRVHGQSKERVPFPCQKPIELLRRLVLLLTEEGDLVIDPRLGSGTTAVVAQELRRGCVGMDRRAEALGVAKGRME